jgi:hypothetical protein
MGERTSERIRRRISFAPVISCAITD